jgi:hypothetical protein
MTASRPETVDREATRLNGRGRSEEVIPPSSPTPPWYRRRVPLAVGTAAAVLALISGGRYLLWARAHESTNDALHRGACRRHRP